MKAKKIVKPKMREKRVYRKRKTIVHATNGLNFDFLKEKVIKKSILKIVVFLMIVTLNWSGLFAIGRTFSYFNDTEDSSSNLCLAGTLDFSLRSGQSNFAPNDRASNMKPGESVARDIYIKKEGSLPFKYNAVSEFVDGECDLELYNALSLKIWYNWYDAIPDPSVDHKHMDLKYNGPLKDFDLRLLNPDDVDLQIPNSHEYFDNMFYGVDEHWFYASEVILPADVSPELQNKSCKFNFVFNGWQEDLADGLTGFSDTESITSTIATGDWAPMVTVEYPNGGETWYMVPYDWPTNSNTSAICQALGMNDQCQYPINWTAVNPIGDDIDLLIDIHFSFDSGGSWIGNPPVVLGTQNSGLSWWKLPFEDRYITTTGRIKVLAQNSVYPFLVRSDISDSDFCPPAITSEAEAIALLASINGISLSDELNILGIDNKSSLSGMSPIVSESPVVDEEVSVDEKIPMDEEILVEQETTVDEEVSVDEEIPVEQEMPVVEEVFVDEEIPVEQEMPVVEEVSVDEEISVSEELVAEEPITEEPIIEEEPIISDEDIFVEDETIVIDEAVDMVDNENIDIINSDEIVVTDQEILTEEEPAIEQPIIEEPVAEEPVAEEPITEEPIIEEPVTIPEENNGAEIPSPNDDGDGDGDGDDNAGSVEEITQ